LLGKGCVYGVFIEELRIEKRVCSDALFAFETSLRKLYLNKFLLKLLFSKKPRHAGWCE
jgi:hypothetical protein